MEQFQETCRMWAACWLWTHCLEVSQTNRILYEQLVRQMLLTSCGHCLTTQLTAISTRLLPMLWHHWVKSVTRHPQLLPSLIWHRPLWTSCWRHWTNVQNGDRFSFWIHWLPMHPMMSGKLRGMECMIERSVVVVISFSCVLQHMWEGYASFVSC